MDVSTMPARPSALSAHAHAMRPVERLCSTTGLLLVLSGLTHLVVFAIDGWTGHPVTSPLRWVHCLTGAIIWPPAAAILSSAEGRLA